MLGAASASLTDGEVEHAALFDLRAERTSEKRERPHPALPHARLSATSRSSFSITTRTCCRASIAVKDVHGRVSRIDRLTHDIRLHRDRARRAHQILGGAICRHHRHDRAGETITRSFSMANPPRRRPKSSSSSSRNTRRNVLRSYSTAELEVGDGSCADGPYGTCFRREERAGPDDPGRRRFGHVAALVDPQRSSEERRTAADPLLLRRADARRSVLPRRNRRADGRASRDFEFIPGAVARRRPTTHGTGERGFVHERRCTHLAKSAASTARSTSTPAGRRR